MLHNQLILGLRGVGNQELAWCARKELNLRPTGLKSLAGMRTPRKSASILTINRAATSQYSAIWLQLCNPAQPTSPRPLGTRLF